MDYLLFTYPNCAKCEALKKKLAETGTPYAGVQPDPAAGQGQDPRVHQRHQAGRQGRHHPADPRRPHPGHRPGRRQHGRGVRRVVEIKGIEKFSSRDFPGHISSTVFLGGCTFRCPYCHNAELVLRPETIPSLAADLLPVLSRRPQGLARGRLPHRRGAAAPRGPRGAHPRRPGAGPARQDRHERLVPGPPRGPSRPRARRLGGHGRQGPARALPRGDPVERRPGEDRPERGPPPQLGREAHLPDHGRPGARRQGGRGQDRRMAQRGRAAIVIQQFVPQTTIDPGLPRGQAVRAGRARGDRGRGPAVFRRSPASRPVTEGDDAMELKVKRIHPEAKLPVYGHPGDAGLDLFSVVDRDLAPGRGLRRADRDPDRRPARPRRPRLGQERHLAQGRPPAGRASSTPATGAKSRWS